MFTFMLFVKWSSERTKTVKHEKGVMFIEAAYQTNRLEFK